MFKQNKLFTITLGVTIVIVISTFISWLLGFEGFLLVGDLTLPKWVNYIVCLTTFYLTFLAWAGVALKEYSLKLFKYALPYIPIMLLSKLIPVNFILPGTLFMSFIIPFTYLCFLGVLKKDLKNTIRRAIKFAILVSAYQLVMSALKVNLLNFNQYSLSLYQALAFSIDSLIFQGILFLYGGEFTHYVQFSSKLVWPWNDTAVRSGLSAQHSDHSRTQSSSEISNELDEACSEFNTLNKWQRNLTLLFYLGIQLVQCIIVLAVCRIGNVFVEGLIILTSFVLHGFILRERIHSKSIIVCTITSSVMFLIAAKLTPSFYFSQFLPILIGLLLTYSLYKINRVKKARKFQRWYNTIVEFITGRYKLIANRKEVAYAKGLSHRDLKLINCNSGLNNPFAGAISKLSPWNDSEYTDEECSE